MKNCQQLTCNISIALCFLLFFFPLSKAADSVCKLNPSDPSGISYTITVNRSGHGNFTDIQSAIDSLPSHNTRWIRIQISADIYQEKVTIPEEKPCLVLQGAINHTIIEYNAHQETDTSATFTSYADDIVAQDIAFKNNYNVPMARAVDGSPMVQALSARIYGDRSAFYRCSFVGLQDTLWDATGRHYFSQCYIEGGVDFIFGQGQSIYEKCYISVNMGIFGQQATEGYITAQNRSSADDPSGFVFKYCRISGVGQVYLGRAYGPYSRVIFYMSYLANIIVPEGWYAWNFKGKEQNFEYVEEGNRGPGADTSHRVPWLKRLPRDQLTPLVDMSYINHDGWMGKLPKH